MCPLKTDEFLERLESAYTNLNREIIFDNSTTGLYAIPGGDGEVSMECEFRSGDMYGSSYFLEIWLVMSVGSTGVSQDMKSCWAGALSYVDDYISRLSRNRMFRELSRLMRVAQFSQLFGGLRNLHFMLSRQTRPAAGKKGLEVTSACSVPIPPEVVLAWYAGRRR